MLENVDVARIGCCGQGNPSSAGEEDSDMILQGIAIGSMTCARVPLPISLHLFMQLCFFPSLVRIHVHSSDVRSSERLGSTDGRLFFRETETDISTNLGSSLVIVDMQAWANG